MPTYSVNLTDVENKALCHVCASPQEWIENFVKERCRVAIDEIVQKEVSKMLEDDKITSMPADKELIVMNALL